MVESSGASAISKLTQQNEQSGSIQQSQEMLGKDDFLQLLVTQLENQDPLKPMDPEQMTAQLAQFSSLEQLTNINKSMQGLDQMVQGLNQANALDMLGKQVQLEGNSFTLSQEEAKLHYRLPQEADEVTVHVMDNAGEKVAELGGGGTSAGEHAVTWNGENQDSEPCPPGKYSFVVEARKEEKVLRTEPLVLAQVNGVDYSDTGQAVLQTSAGEVVLGKVEKVRTSEQSS